MYLDSNLIAVVKEFQVIKEKLVKKSKNEFYLLLLQNMWQVFKKEK